MTRWIGTLLLAMMLAGCQPAAPEEAPLAQWLGADGSAFPALDPAYVPQFPRDFGAHPEQRVEWWYATFNLQDADGRRWGAQLALFRLALEPHAVDMEGWDARQLFMAHVAISDLHGQRFAYRERLARPVLDLAGVQDAPFAVWVEQCRLQASTNEPPMRRRIDCTIDGLSLQLSVEADGPPLLHGRNGYSEKSGAGNASFYYSQPWLLAQGTLQFPGDAPVAVAGRGWFDHEWSPGLLKGGQRGWDWLSLQLDDGRALMLFRLHDGQGGAAEVRGSLIGAGGAVRNLAEDAATMQPIRWWTSPHSGVRYPLDWRISLLDPAVGIEVRARMDDQELNTQIRYWEGSVAAQGHADDKPVSGEGYLELTGYARR
jgi:predicted secreted hydrolase